MHSDLKYDKREKLTAEVVRVASDLPYPLRLSEAFMKLWCGTHGPNEELEGYLTERGLRFVPGTDIQAGWDIKRIGEEERGDFQLR